MRLVGCSSAYRPPYPKRTYECLLRTSYRLVRASDARRTPGRWHSSDSSWARKTCRRYTRTATNSNSIGAASSMNSGRPDCDRRRVGTAAHRNQRTGTLFNGRRGHARDGQDLQHGAAARARHRRPDGREVAARPRPPTHGRHRAADMARPLRHEKGLMRRCGACPVAVCPLAHGSP